MHHRVRYIQRSELRGVPLVAVQREDGSMATGRYLVRRRGRHDYVYIQYRDGERVKEKYWGIVAENRGRG